MDLINHIPGVGASGPFNPGITTPAPFNVPQIGAVDGTGPANATKNMAELYNRNLLWRRALIANAGLAFDPTNWVQEAQAVQALIDAAARRTGQIFYVAANVPPVGALKRNGALISRTTYAGLWAWAQASGNLAASDGVWQAGQFSPGDGATTFRIPDARGTVDRAWDDGRGVDPGRAIGTEQLSANKQEVSSFQIRSDVVGGAIVNSGSGGFVLGNGGSGSSLQNGGAVLQSLITLTVGTATEARMRNNASLACIWY